MASTLIFADEVVQITDKAILLDLDGSPVWVPKSVITRPDELFLGDKVVSVEIEDWFLRKEELI